MLKFALIAMLVATVIAAVGVCFTKKYKVPYFLLQTFSFVTLACLGLVAGNYVNDFSGYTILMIASVVPMFLSIFDLQSYLKSKQEIVEVVKEEQIEKESKLPPRPQKQADEEEKPAKEKKKKSAKYHFLNSNGFELTSLAYLLSSIPIGICGLYLGIETFYGFLIGLGIALAITFLTLARKKVTNPFDIFSKFVAFLAVGFLIGQALTVILYSFALPNILYCAGALLLSTNFLIRSFVKTSFDHLFYFAGMICFMAVIIL